MRITGSPCDWDASTLTKIYCAFTYAPARNDNIPLLGADTIFKAYEATNVKNNILSLNFHDKKLAGNLWTQYLIKNKITYSVYACDEHGGGCGVYSQGYMESANPINFFLFIAFGLSIGLAILFTLKMFFDE